MSVVIINLVVRLLSPTLFWLLRFNFFWLLNHRFLLLRLFLRLFFRLLSHWLLDWRFLYNRTYIFKDLLSEAQTIVGCVDHKSELDDFTIFYPPLCAYEHILIVENPLLIRADQLAKHNICPTVVIPYAGYGLVILAVRCHDFDDGP